MILQNLLVLGTVVCAGIKCTNIQGKHGTVVHLSPLYDWEILEDESDGDTQMEQTGETMEA